MDSDVLHTYLAVLIRQYGKDDKVVLSREVYDTLSETLGLNTHLMDNGDVELLLIEH